MNKPQDYIVRVWKAGPATMMMLEPMGYIGENGLQVDTEEGAKTFNYFEDIGKAQALFLQKNGNGIGGIMFEPDLVW